MLRGKVSVASSWATRGASSRVHRSRTPRRYPGGGTMTPELPVTDSRTSAAIVEGPSSRTTCSRFARARSHSSAGLLEANSAALAGDEPDRLQELLAGADRRLLAHRRSSRPDKDRSDDERRENRIRRLGAFEFRRQDEPRADKSLDDLLAAVYLPPADEGGALLEALPDGCHTLQVLLDPADEDLVRWSWSAPGARSSMGSLRLSPTALDLLSVLRSGERATERLALTVDGLRPLSALLPPGLITALSAGGPQDLLIVPAGELWVVPWGALPLEGGLVLGEAQGEDPGLEDRRLVAHRSLHRPEVRRQALGGEGRFDHPLVQRGEQV